MLNSIFHAGVSTLGGKGLAVVLGLIAGLLAPFIKKAVIAGVEAVKAANTRLGKVSPVVESVAEMGERSLFAVAIQHKAAIEASAAKLDVPVEAIDTAIAQLRDSEQKILGFADPTGVSTITVAVAPTSTAKVTIPPTLAPAQSNPVAPAQSAPGSTSGQPEASENSIPSLGSFGPVSDTNPPA